MKEAMTFLSDYGFESARATLLLEDGDPVQAAEIHFEGGRLESGIKILLKHMDTSKDCAESLAKRTIEALWKLVSFGVVLGNVVERKALKRWLEVAGKLEDAHLCSTFSFLSEHDLEQVCASYASHGYQK